MEWQLLNVEAAREIYNRHMVRDFPKSELKPFTAIHRMMQAGKYEPWGARDSHGELCAYAYLALAGSPRTPLLDYFAVLPALRGTGYGTRLLAELRNNYCGRADFLCIESEYPPLAPDPQTAARRLGFYRRAGAVQTKVLSRIFGVQYCNFALPVTPETPTDAQVLQALGALYRAMVPPRYYEGNIEIRME